jgi:hypothetical protein
MLTVSLRRKTLLLLLVALLITPWASAASLQHASPRVEQAVESVPLVGHFWHLLQSVWGKAGCRIDPDGRCADSPTDKRPLQPKAGCRIDPNGGPCLP